MYKLLLIIVVYLHYMFYFQTLIVPSLLLDKSSLWFNLTEARERMESRWQPPVSVAAEARTAFPVGLVANGRLFASYNQHIKIRAFVVTISCRMDK